jgi:HJR/Mrr/RecB family endonuclease
MERVQEINEIIGLATISFLWTIAFFGLFLSMIGGLWTIFGYLIFGFFYLTGIAIYLQTRGSIGITFLAILVGISYLTLSTSTAITGVRELILISNGLFFIVHPIYKYKKFKSTEEERKEKQREKNKERLKKEFPEIYRDEDSSVDREDLKLSSVGDQEFEELIADIWEEKGWDTEVTQKSIDKGVDIRAYKYSPYQRKILIQAKNFIEGNKVGSKAVQQYNSLRDQEEKVDEVLIVTTSGYTSQAEKLAESLNVKLIDRSDLKEIIEEVDGDLADIIEK